MTNDTSWVDRTWRELQNAVNWANDTTIAGNDPTDPWNSQHFLDVGELTAAFAIAYDWLYDQWTSDQKTTIVSNIVDYGLQKGVTQYSTNAFWLTVNGNWNCGKLDPHIEFTSYLIVFSMQWWSHYGMPRNPR